MLRNRKNIIAKTVDLLVGNEVNDGDCEGGSSEDQIA